MTIETRHYMEEWEYFTVCGMPPRRIVYATDVCPDVDCGRCRATRRFKEAEKAFA